MNKVIFIGRLTKDPVIRITENNKIGNFSIAIDRHTKEGEEKQADFPRITVFGKQAENAEKYLKKGMLVCVEGSVRTGQFTKDDAKVYTTDFIADRVEYLSWNDRKE